MSVTIYFKPRKIVFDQLIDGRYQEYLQSPEWKELRREVIERARGCCETCGEYIGNRGQVHHVTYERLFQEELDDLTYKCTDCHHRMG